MSQSVAFESAEELTRRAITAGNVRDFDAMVECFGEESTVDLESFGLGVHVGRAAIRRFLLDWIGSCEEVTFEIQSSAEPSDGVVWVVVHQRARPAAGSALSLRYAAVYVWEQRLVSRVTHHRTVADARATARATGELLA